MSKKFFVFPLAALLAAPVMFADANKKGSEVKVGYFNSANIVSKSNVGKEAFKELDEKRLAYGTEIKKLNDEYEKKVKDFQAKSSALSMVAKEKEEQEILKARRDIENKAKGYEEDLRLLARQTQERVFNELSDAVYEFGRSENSDVMLDVATGRVVVINPDKVGSDEKILKAMDKNHAVKVAKGAGKTKKTATT